MSEAEQLGLPGMPQRLFTCTPTRLTTWLDCPRRYRFTYLDRPPPPKGPPWAHNSLGSSVHLALAGWHRLDARERSVEAAGRLLEHVWLKEGFRDDEQSAVWRSRAREMVMRYVDALDPGEEPLGIERTVGMRTDSLAVSGRIDRLDQRQGADGDVLVVVDYKTGRRELTAYDARSSLALALYALAAGRTFRRPCLRVELHHVPSGEVLAQEHTLESLQRHLARAEAIGAEAGAADAAYRAGLSDDEADALFPPQVSSSCRYCDFVRSCPQGFAAHQPASSWAAVNVDGA
ncbi:MAG: RecB family exonuclease [Actinomycetes bacterium]